MAPKKTGGSLADGADAPGQPDLTANEQRVITAAMQALKVPPELDYDKMAELLGYSNSRSASNAWSAIKSKIFNKDSVALKRGPKAGAKGSRNDKARAKIAGARGKKNGKSDNGDKDDKDATDSDKAATTTDSSEEGDPGKGNKRAAPKAKAGGSAKKAKTTSSVKKEADSDDEQLLINKQIADAAPMAEEAEQEESSGEA